LRVWKDYFPNAMIFGADIDRDILFQEDRIKTFYMDQLDSKSIQDFWRMAECADFNLMVDDGLHTFEAGSTLFLNSIEYLAPEGVYVIEDVNLVDLLRYKAFFQKTSFLVDFVMLEGPNRSVNGNCLVVIRK
jgi:hypothetical protein